MLKRILAVTTMAVMLVGTAYANEEKYVDTKTDTDLKKGESYERILNDDDKEVIESEQKALKEHGIKTEELEEKTIEEKDAEQKEASPLHDVEITDALNKSPVKSLFNNGYIQIDGPNKSGYITITANLQNYPGYSFNSIYMDGYKINFTPAINGKTALNATVDMKMYKVGYHTMTFYYNYNGSLVNVSDTATYIPTYIYNKPSNPKKNYLSGQKYVYYYGDSGNCNGEYLNVYAQLKRGKKWEKTVYYGRPYKFKKLKPNKKYQFRTMYAKTFEYNANTYTFTGGMTGKVSGRAKIYTAYSKKQMKKILKKISIKAKIKSYKYWRAYKNTYYWWGYRTHYKKAKAYYTISKVTVQFKKKPKIRGVEIKDKYGSVVRKGNKKKYSFKVAEAGKRKGKKYNIKVRSYRADSYYGSSGISPFVKKKVRSH